MKKNKQIIEGQQEEQHNIPLYQMAEPPVMGADWCTLILCAADFDRFIITSQVQFLFVLGSEYVHIDPGNRLLIKKV